jgi:putative heme iron utilization protein
MNADKARLLRELLDGSPVGALGTLHEGAPFVSMVPFARMDGGLVIHISQLASHTADLAADPRVSLMVMAERAETPSSRARATLQCRAAPIEPSTARHAEAKAVYLARFPDRAPMFELADFRLVRLQPISARIVGGFAQAYSLDADAIAAALA